MKKNWIFKTPKSAEQVLSCINEANALYAEYKQQTRKDKTKYLQEAHNAGIYVGTIIELPRSKELIGQKLKVIDIKGTVIMIQDKDGKRWRCKDYIISEIKIINEV